MEVKNHQKTLQSRSNGLLNNGSNQLPYRPLYSVIIPCKDGNETICETLNSILKQTILPSDIVIIDDCSEVEVSRTLELSKVKYPVYIVRLERRHERDYSYIAHLINIGLPYTWRKGCPRFIMISGADCVYPSNYVETLIEEFNKDMVAVVSGEIQNREIVLGERMPRGSGRIISFMFLTSLYPLPIKIGWESWILFKALERGWRISCLDIRFRHIKEHSSFSLRTFGHAQYTLGYPFVFVLLKVFIRRNLQQFLGYFEYFITSKEKFENSKFVSKNRKQYLIKEIKSLMRIRK